MEAQYNAPLSFHTASMGRVSSSLVSGIFASACSARREQDLVRIRQGVIRELTGSLQSLQICHDWRCRPSPPMRGVSDDGGRGEKQ